MATDPTITSLASAGKEINYLSRDFNSFKENLVNYAKSYYSGSYKDFSENSTGMMFIELASYVGDVLSYYIDYQFKEGFMQYASERKNIVTLANYLGYKIRTSIAATTEIEVYHIIPSKIGPEGTNVPDYKYALNIRQGMEVTSSDGSGTIFRTISDVNFVEETEESPRDISVYERDSVGQPTFYLLRKLVRASAGTRMTKTVSVGSAEEFFEINLPETNVLEITSVTDASGNAYHEVPYLSQDTILIEEVNSDKNNPMYSKYSESAPYIMRFIRTSRRYTTLVNADNTTTLEFGAGSDKFDDEIIVPSLNNVGRTLRAGRGFEAAYDPSNFLKSDSYGTAPGNTTLNVVYYVGGGVSSNVPSNTLNTINSISYGDNSQYLEPEELLVLDMVKSSVTVNNIEPALGGKGPETDDEIRLNGLASFSAQNRAVTRDDYIIRAYSMPSRFGSIAKAYVSKDGLLDSRAQREIIKLTESDDVKVTPGGMNSVYGEINNPLAINMYILSYDKNKHLISPNDAVLRNLRTYMESYRILTDGLNLTNAFIINIGVNFEISVFHNFNKKQVLFQTMTVISSLLDMDSMSIMQPIELGTLEIAAASVAGVKSVTSLEIVNLTTKDGEYSENEYDIKSATVGKTLYPSMDPSIFELKFPSKDIVGRVV